MTYSPTTWEDDSTPLDETNLGKIEQGIYDLSACSGAGVTAPTRVLGTVYQNTTGQLIAVLVCVTVLNGSAIAYEGATSSPATQVAKVANGSTSFTQTMMLYFVVPPSYYYKVASSGTVSKTNWQESTLH